MKIISIIPDNLLHARSILLEMTIGEYIPIGKRILKTNTFQRRRVKNSSSMYSLLRQDLRSLCTMPPLVLAYNKEYEGSDLNEASTSMEIQEQLSSEGLMILDGLQRTYTLLDVLSDLTLSDEEETEYKNHRIRVELYVGLSRTGVLYRMLTLNSGQTPMSKRHEIEILYSDFLKEPIGNIKFLKQVSNEKIEDIDTYDFDDTIEGFNSFIERDETPLTKLDLLDIVVQLNAITKQNFRQDIFREFIQVYNNFVHQLSNITDNWTYQVIPQQEIKSLYGCDLPHFFNKSQTISSFGAAIGTLIYEGKICDLSALESQFTAIVLGEETNKVFFELLSHLEEVRQKAKKIGVEQRCYLKYLFYDLFNSKGNSFLNMKLSIESSFKKYSDEKWKSNITSGNPLFM